MATKKTKKKVSKKVEKKTEKKVRGVGVIAYIQKLVEGGPISAKSILHRLEKKFPDRPSEGMAKTIQAQLPNRMSREKKIKIIKNDEGQFYVKSK